MFLKIPLKTIATSFTQGAEEMLDFSKLFLSFETLYFFILLNV